MSCIYGLTGWGGCVVVDAASGDGPDNVGSNLGCFVSTSRVEMFITSRASSSTIRSKEGHKEAISSGSVTSAVQLDREIEARLEGHSEC